MRRQREAGPPLVFLPVHCGRRFRCRVRLWHVVAANWAAVRRGVARVVPGLGFIDRNVALLHSGLFRLLTGYCHRFCGCRYRLCRRLRRFLLLSDLRWTLPALGPRAPLAALGGNLRRSTAAEACGDVAARAPPTVRCAPPHHARGSGHTAR